MAASSRSCCRWSCSSRPGSGSCVSRVAAGGQHSHGLEQGPRARRGVCLGCRVRSSETRREGRDAGS